MSNPLPTSASATSAMLKNPVTVNVRIEGAVVCSVQTRSMNQHQVILPSDELPLSVNAFVELEVFDGTDRLLLPGRVTQVNAQHITVDYEQVGETFLYWLGRNQ